jgi:hypothetical protein
MRWLQRLHGELNDWRARCEAAESQKHVIRCWVAVLALLTGCAAGRCSATVRLSRVSPITCCGWSSTGRIPLRRAHLFFDPWIELTSRAAASRTYWHAVSSCPTSSTSCIACPSLYARLPAHVAHDGRLTRVRPTSRRVQQSLPPVMPTMRVPLPCSTSPRWESLFSLCVSL